MLLEGKRILVGISGGIAAYKALFLVRLLRKEGAEVKCVCTPAALEFVTRLSLETLSGNPVYTDLFSSRNEYSTAHISHADWADLFIVAPATANTIAKFANGIADNALTTVFNAFRKPVIVAPAMNTGMYRHPATRANIGRLENWGISVIQPENGFLACGTEGEGRMPEPEAILQHVVRFFSPGKPEKKNDFFSGKKVLLTAGPTVEAIDPVRYISNHSTGKMGCCIADALIGRGAEVYLVCGPMPARPERKPYRMLPVTSAGEMYSEAVSLWPDMDMAILCAAVADYTPVEPCLQKIKKKEAGLTLRLSKTRDILATLGETKRSGQFLAGFALETENELENAREKLRKKKADMIVLNSLRDPGSGFGTSTNRVTFVDRTGGVTPRDLKSKTDVAADLLDFIASFSGQTQNSKP